MRASANVHAFFKFNDIENSGAPFKWIYGCLSFFIGLFMFVLLFGWSKIIIWVLSDEFFEYLVFYGGSDERWENNSDWKNMGQRVFFLVVVIGVLWKMDLVFWDHLAEGSTVL